MNTKSIILTLGVVLWVAEPSVAQATPESKLAGKSASLRGKGLNFRLRKLLAAKGVRAVTPPPKQDPALVELGRNLFFDKELSGPRSIACSTCHNPFLGTADGQSLSRAQGAVGLGAARRQGPRSIFLPRNALSLWNRGVPVWDTMFWDGRLGRLPDGSIFSPAGDLTPQGFTSPLAAFTILPITPREEMRGFIGELDRFGEFNELGVIADGDFIGKWEGVVARVKAVPGYRPMILAAFPEQSIDDFDIVDFGNAVGAFETDAFTALDSPFDRFLAGEFGAMSDAQKRGAILFYGRANCSECHAGALQTDFEFHNIAVPQAGIGRPGFEPLDIGRAEQTGVDEDRFAFRTPSLRNIAVEAPYMHNGAYTKLVDAVRHHLDPETYLLNYDPSQLEPELQDTLQDDPALIAELLERLDPALGVRGRPLSDREFSDIISFLNGLTDPASLQKLIDVTPDNVPSGLPLAD